MKKAHSLSVLALGFSLLILAGLPGCIDLQQALGLSVQDSGQGQQVQEQATATLPAGILPIEKTVLAGIFEKNVWDGSSSYPHVAITVTDWSRKDYWLATAVVWWSASRSQKVPQFAVGNLDKAGMNLALEMAAYYHAFGAQTTTSHTGNKRTTGPKPPMFPALEPFSAAQWDLSQLNGTFVEVLLKETGWTPGPPTNMWFVKYDNDAMAKNQQQAQKSK